MALQIQKTQTALSEINVTPLVDVMLVLLIVFMISAPLMQQGIQVDLPKANAQTLSEVPDQVLLVVKKNHQLLLNGNPIQTDNLRNLLLRYSKAKPDVQVFIQADESLPYGMIASIMAEVKQAQVSHVGLVTEPPTSDTHGY